MAYLRPNGNSSLSILCSSSQKLIQDFELVIQRVMSRATADDQLRFLLSCVKHSNNGKIDFIEVAQDCGIVSKGAAAKRYERLMKANGIHPSCDKPASPSMPKEKSKAAIARAAAAKRRKIEGDLYDVKQDDEDETKPFIMKDEPSDGQQIKSEVETGFSAYPQPQMSMLPPSPYFPQALPPAIHRTNFQAMSSPMLSPSQHHYYSSASGQTPYPPPRNLPFSNMFSSATHFLASPPGSTMPSQSHVGEQPADQLSSFRSETIPQDEPGHADAYVNYETASSLSSIGMNSRSQRGTAVSMADPSTAVMPLSPQEVVPCTQESVQALAIQHQQPLNDVQQSPPSMHLSIAGQGIENSILIVD